MSQFEGLTFDNEYFWINFLSFYFLLLKIETVTSKKAGTHDKSFAKSLGTQT